MTSPLPSRILAGAFIASGAVHLIRPRVFRPLIPPVLPAPDAWTVGSGVVEIACGVGLLTRQPWAPAASAATLVGVWPGNIWHALRTSRSEQPAWLKAAMWARVPLQLPLVAVALRAPVRGS